MALYQMVRAPIETGRKSGTIDIPGDYKSSILRWRDTARNEAIATLQMHPEYAELPKYIDFIEGRQWNQNRPRYRSQFYDNRIAEAREQALALLTDIRPAIDVATSVPAYKQHADIAKNIILYEWSHCDMDLALVSVVDHGLMGTGYWKIGALSPGMMVITPGGMDTVLPIQRGRTIQDSSAVLYRTYKNLQYFREKWGSRADGLEKESASGYWANTNNQYVRPGNVQESTWNSLSPAMKYHLGVRSARKSPTSSTPFPVLELEEYWIDDPSINDSNQTVTVKDPYLDKNSHNYWYEVAPGQRLFPRKRLVVFAGNKVMYDGPSPYWHGLYPFAELNLNPIVWGPGGLSMYRDLIPLSKAINEIAAGTLDLVKKAINPQMLTKDGAVKDAAWQKFYPDMPGGRLKLTPVGNVMTDVRYMEPPPLPGYVSQMLGQYLMPTFDRRTGQIDASALGRKNQVPGGDTIEQMRDSMQTSFRIRSRYIEAFLRDAGIQAVSNIFQCYTAKQRMRLLGADGTTWEDYDYDPETMVPWSTPKCDHWRNFAMRISPGSLHGGARDRTKQLAISLFRLGAISRRELLRQLEWNASIEQIEEELEQQNAGEAGGAPDATGKGRVPRLTRGQKNGEAV